MTRLYGQKLAKVAIDECAFFTIDLAALVDDIIRPTLSDLQGQLILCSIPGFVQRGLFWDVVSGKRKGWSLHQWTAFENPHMEKQFRADIAEMKEMTPLEAEAFSAKAHRTFGRLEDLSIPTIAAVNGFALGGGCELALCCDWIYASTKAKIGQPETKLGLIPGFGGTSRLVRRVGLAWAKELVLIAEPIAAEEAARIGLANRIFEPDELLPAAIAAGAAIAARGPVATRLAKEIMQQGQDADVRLAHALEQRAFGLSFASEDRIEGTTAFVEKREPDFKGR